MSPRPPRRSTTATALSGLFVASVTATFALLANAQTVSDTTETGGLTEVTSPTYALSNSFQPTTPWPITSALTSDSSQTMLAPQHDLLAYSGVDAKARKLVGDDYIQWVSHFSGKTPARSLPQGLLVSTGCLAPNCELRKSLLVVSPVNQKVYAAMVTEGKVAMWPSLMSWPDDAIPTLKTWLAEASPDDDDSSTSPTTATKTASPTTPETK